MDSGFHEQEYPRFRNPNSVWKSEIFSHSDDQVWFLSHWLISAPGCREDDDQRVMICWTSTSRFFFLMGLTAVKRRHFLGNKTPPNSESWSLSHKSTQCMVYHCQCYLPCGSLTWRHQRSAIWASLTIAPCKEIQDSLGFWVPVPGFRIICQWNLDSGFQSLSDSGFPELYSGFHKKKIWGIPEMGRLLA